VTRLAVSHVPRDPPPYAPARPSRCGTTLSHATVNPVTNAVFESGDVLRLVPNPGSIGYPQSVSNCRVVITNTDNIGFVDLVFASFNLGTGDTLAVYKGAQLTGTLTGLIGSYSGGTLTTPGPGAGDVYDASAGVCQCAGVQVVRSQRFSLSASS
jgi:hypothetical protein